MAVIMLPLVIAALLYYLLKPIVDFIEKRGTSRVTAITIVFLAIAGLLAWELLIFFQCSMISCLLYQAAAKLC